MKTERVVLAVTAIIIGLGVAGIAFFIYQSTKVIPTNKTQVVKILTPTPTPPTNSLLTISSPSDESVVATRSVTITGKTDPTATLILNTASDDQVVTPATNGNFSITATLADGENVLTLTAVMPDGNEVAKQLTITSSTEQF